MLSEGKPDTKQYLSFFWYVVPKTVKLIKEEKCNSSSQYLGEKRIGSYYLMCTEFQFGKVKNVNVLKATNQYTLKNG